MNKNKDKSIRVNVCWELGDNRKCETMQKEDAYKTRRWVEANNGFVFWFQALDDQSFQPVSSLYLRIASSIR